MKFYPLTNAAPASADLASEYAAAREVGVIRLGTDRLFFRSKRKHYYIPYSDITRCYRRVLMVPARLCCGRGSFDIEHLVLEQEGKELAQIQLPGTRAAKVLMDELQALAPQAQFGKLPQAAEGPEDTPAAAQA